MLMYLKLPLVLLLTCSNRVTQMCPRLIDAPLLEDERTVAVACGARHSVVLTGMLEIHKLDTSLRHVLSW